jgi:hypothetical protein
MPESIDAEISRAGMVRRTRDNSDTGR